MPILPIEESQSKPKKQMSVHTLTCDACAKTLYSSGPHVAGSEIEQESIDRAERMQDFHSDGNPGHRTRLYLDSHNILISTRVKADEGVRA